MCRKRVLKLTFVTVFGPDEQKKGLTYFIMWVSHCCRWDVEKVRYRMGIKFITVRNDKSLLTKIDSGRCSVQNETMENNTLVREMPLFFQFPLKFELEMRIKINRSYNRFSIFL